MEKKAVDVGFPDAETVAVWSEADWSASDAHLIDRAAKNCFDSGFDFGFDWDADSDFGSDSGFDSGFDFDSDFVRRAVGVYDIGS